MRKQWQGYYCAWKTNNIIFFCLEKTTYFFIPAETKPKTISLDKKIDLFYFAWLNNQKIFTCRNKAKAFLCLKKQNHFALICSK